jgi:hypothetical protein
MIYANQSKRWWLSDPSSGLGKDKDLTFDSCISAGSFACCISVAYLDGRSPLLGNTQSTYLVTR